MSAQVSDDEAAPTVSRADRTRAAILRAARVHFTAHGYERATIRAIARDAGIDPALVIRYFGSKDALFATAAAIDLNLPDLRGIARDQLGTALVGHFLDRWEGDLADDALIFLFRAGMTNEAAAVRLRETFIDQIARPIVATLDSPEAERRATMVGTQMLGVAVCRYILRLPPLVAVGKAALAADLAPTVQRYLTGELTPDEAPVAVVDPSPPAA